MRAPVFLSSLVFALPLLACDGTLTEPQPDDTSTELVQPPSADPLFDEARGQSTETQARTRKGPASDIPETTAAEDEEEGVEDRKQRRSKYGK